MTKVKYFFQFIFIIILFLIFKIIGLKNSSRFSGKLFKIIGPFFRSGNLIHENIKKALPTISLNKITIGAAQFILEKQLRNIGNVLEKFITVKIAQPQYDALLYHFFYEGVDTIKDSPITKLINAKDWYSITDEIQSNIKKNGKVDNILAQRKIKTAQMFSYVPGI